MERLKAVGGAIFRAQKRATASRAATTAKVNKILARPRIARVRQGTGPKLQAATLKTVTDFVKRNPSYKP